ncbi:hypothetical protein AB0L63_03720 [Nocardia sp. NPDC051990]|uniref:hypothetical protein n=1 Tax=Nocardia sp. NPDC051990 TaxID=3155285 RepID=UPI0034306778
MSTNASMSALPDDLLRVIGRIAAASAVLEGTLRTTLAAIANLDDGLIILEGQSIDWLIQNSIAAIDDFPSNHRLSSPGHSLRDLLKSAEHLKNDRNIVVHGEWRTRCTFSNASDPQGCKPRSPQTLLSDRTFHVLRSRYRRNTEESCWSLDELHTLAESIRALELELRKICRDDLHSAYVTKWNCPLPVWEEEV